MKKAAIFLKIWIIFLYPAALIQGQSGNDVVYQVGNPGNDDTCVLNNILIDKDHRIITTGSFAGAAYVKNSSDRFLSSNTSSILLKIDKSGNSLLQEVLYGGGPNHANKIIGDADGNIYISGSFNDYIYIGGFTVKTIRYPGAYMAKFDSSGAPQWLKAPATNNGNTTINAMTSDINGSFFATITTRDTSLSIDGQHFKTNYQTFSVLLKYDKKGNIIWSKLFNSSTVTSITSDSFGNLYILGSLNGGKVLYNGTPPVGLKDTNNVFYFAKLNASNGDMLWIKTWQGDLTKINNLRMGYKGGIYACGLFYDSININNTIYKTDYALNIILKFDSAGNISWYKVIPTSSPISVSGFTISKVDDIYISGTFGNSIKDSVLFDSCNLKSTTGYDIFILKLNSDGQLVGYKTSLAEYNAGCYSFSLAMDDDTLYSAGFIYGTNTFDNTKVTARGFMDGYIWKVASDFSGIPYIPKVNLNADIYPNPISRGYAYLNLSVQRGGNYEIDCIDITGRKIWSGEISAKPSLSEYKIALPAVNPGMYCFRITNGTETVFRKIVIN